MTLRPAQGPPLARRLAALPAYLFAAMDEAKQAARAAGRDLVDLGVGDPDHPTPAFLVRAMQRAVQDPAHHRYALDQGMPALREAIACWMRRRFGVTLDPRREILPLIGSKEGIAHLPLAYLNPGDRVLVPDPAYPAYQGATILAGGVPVPIPLTAEHGFLPEIRQLQRAITRRTKILYLNYPNNPTGATAPRRWFQEVVALAQRTGLLVAHDAAYSEIAFEGTRPASILQIPGAKGVAVEFHSLSKTFNMTGWRIGWVCGHAPAVAALAKVKTNVDSGIFQAIQVTGMAALNAPATVMAPLLRTYQRRRDLLVEGLRQHGWPASPPRATFYLWVRAPKGTRSMAAAERLLAEAGVLLTPGLGFGAAGDGYLRFALTVPEPTIREAVRRIGQIGLWSSPIWGSDPTRGTARR